MRIQDLLAPQNKYLRYTGGCGSCPRKLIDSVPATLRKTKLILVGEAPGAEEVKDQEGFVGKSGQVLRAALAKVGITEFSLSNVVHCRPPDNRDPKPVEISCCMNQFVISEVENYPLVVLVGNTAMKAFFPHSGQTLRGNLAYHPDYTGSRFYGMLHPAAIGYDEGRKEEFYQQVDRLGRIYRGEEPKFKTITGDDFRQQFGAMLAQAKIISMDLETSRLESWVVGGEIRSFTACQVPSKEVFAIDRGDPFWDEALRLLVSYLTNPEKQVVGQNVGYDLVWLESRLGFKCNLKYIHDIQSLYYLLDGLIQAGLKRLVSQKLDGYRHLVVAPDKETNVEHLLLYNAEDSFHAQTLFLDGFPKLRPKTQNLFLTVGGPSSLALRRVQHAGIYFRSGEWEGFVKANREKRETAIAAWAGADPLFRPAEYMNLAGTKGVHKFLFEVKKYPVLKKTPSGEPAADEEVIKDWIRGGATELEHLLIIRGTDKEYSTYLKPYPKLVCPDTHRIHASYHSTKVSTGRLSSSEPNMQNVLRGTIRNLFGSPPGSKFVQGDWSQIELRLAMSEANESAGITAYREGRDLHIETAQFITQKEQVTKDERTYAKSANFCLIYGGGPNTLQAYARNTYGVEMSDQQSADWHRGFFKRYPKITDWHQGTIAKLREAKGYIESAVGHVWYYPDWDSNDGERRTHAERAAINMLCQGPAAYFTTYLIYLAQQEFYKQEILAPQLGFAEIVLTVHDQLAWEVAEEYWKRSVDVVHRCVGHIVEWASWLRVPIELDIEVGEGWGSLQPG